jgi:RNA polymerase sigma-70 factor (ECF subfamily)
MRTLVGADADDVASEAWLQISRDLAGFRGGDADFRAWSVTIARNRALDHLRAVRRRPRLLLPDDVLAERPDLTDTASSAIDAVATERAVAMIASLPRDQAEAVMLRVVVGLDAAAAGRVLGKRVGAVRTAAYRGLRRLADLVDAPGAASDQTGRVPPEGPR